MQGEGNDNDQSAELWGQGGVMSSAKDHFNKVEVALERGAQSDAAEHLHRGLQQLESIGNGLISGRLTESENLEWKELRDKDISLLPDYDRARLRTLNDLALGKIKRTFDPNIVIDITKLK